MIRGRHDERGTADDQRVDEEERAGGAAGQGDQDRGDRDRDRSLDDELGRPEGARGAEVVDDQDEDAGEGEQDEDRGLALRPQAGDTDDGRGGQQEHPGRDAHDPVVGARRHAVVGALLAAAGDGRRGQHPLAANVLGLVGGAPGAGTAHVGRSDEPGHDDEVRDHGDDDQGEDRL